MLLLSDSRDHRAAGGWGGLCDSPPGPVLQQGGVWRKAGVSHPVIRVRSPSAGMRADWQQRAPPQSQERGLLVASSVLDGEMSVPKLKIFSPKKFMGRDV